MVLSATRGALGFLTRLPVGRDERAWRAFRSTPTTLPFVGYPIGAVVALPLLFPAPAPTVAAAFVFGVYLVTGIPHADGLADLGDGLVVHGSPDDRRRVMTDPAIGVGGGLALCVAVLALALAGFALSELPLSAAVGIVVAAEVGAKLAMATVVCLGTAAYEGMGSALAERAGPRRLAAPVAVAIPACVLADFVGTAILVGSVATALALLGTANRKLGGVTGDVFGAGNELARVVGLHVGVIAWTAI